jgi:hypothetical protein
MLNGCWVYRGLIEIYLVSVRVGQRSSDRLLWSPRIIDLTQSIQENGPTKNHLGRGARSLRRSEYK